MTEVEKQFIKRKVYVPGFFMIDYNKTYAHSFGILGLMSRNQT